MKIAIVFSMIILICLVFNKFAQAYEDHIMRLQPPEFSTRELPEKDIGQPQKPEGGILLSGDCSDYEDLSGLELPITVNGTTSGATNNYGPFPSKPNCWAESYWDNTSGAAPDVTYKWTAPADGRYAFSLCRSGYDTVLLLFDFTCPLEPSYPDDFICGNDDYNFCNTNFRSKLSYIPLYASQEVLIVVDGYGSNNGQFELVISEIQTTPVDLFIENMMDIYPIPGLAACVVKDGEIIWTGSYGWAYIDDVEVTDETIFSLASISKTVVGTALMQLSEDYIIQLDNDINDYIPFWVRNPNHPNLAITPRMLLAHTSSIRGWQVVQYIGPGDSPIPLGYFLENYLVPGGQYYSNSNFYSFAPGERYEYCGVANSLAAYLVEAVVDSFPIHCQEQIFQPLEMNETGWFLEDFEDTMDIAMPYDWNGYNYIQYGHYGQPYYPAAQLRSSTLQMARFLIAIMQGGEIDGVRILESLTVELMTTVQNPGIPGYGHPGESGLGWFNIQLFDRTLWGHLGRWWGTTTGMFYSSEENIGVIVFTNEDAIGNGNADHFPDANTFIIYELFEYAAGWPYGSIAGTVTDDASQPLEGIYVIVGRIFSQ